jgi:uncharacterized membrane protein
MNMMGTHFTGRFPSHWSDSILPAFDDLTTRTHDRPYLHLRRDRAFRRPDRSFMEQPPTIPPPAPDGLNSLLLRNIERMKEVQAQDAAAASFEERVASAITRFTGSLKFVYVHGALYGAWIAANLGWLGIAPWDPTFVVLAMIASVEAIFLSTFILISQNRMAAEADRRAELDLQVSLLAEHEVTKLVQLVAEIARRLDIQETSPETEEMKQTVAPEAVLEAIQNRQMKR